MSNLSRDSHYIPQAILRRWSQDGRRIQTYQTLVPHARVPVWNLRSIKGMAFRRDLYTFFSGGEESDNFEHWIAKEFEEPGLEAINKLLSHSRLKREDWRNLARFVASQDVRTPLNFLEQMQRWDQEIPKMMESILKESIEKLQEGKKRELKLQSEADNNLFSEHFKVKMEHPTDPNSDEATLRAEVNIGRNFWITSMRHLLTDAANVLCEHRWSVAEPFGDEEWPLTDHPVLRLNYFGPNKFDFGGGWSKPGSEVMMPVSPRHLLYVQVGQKAPNRLSFSYEQTKLLQELMVKRAHRWIFSEKPAHWMETFRPRLVNLEQYNAEQEAWKNWHQKQIEAENS